MVKIEYNEKELLSFEKIEMENQFKDDLVEFETKI